MHNRPTLQLKKNEDRRLRAGHLWVFSNEVDNHRSPLKKFSPGEEVLVYSHDNTFIGAAYVNPHSLIAARLFTRSRHESFDSALLKKRITSALVLRNQIYTKPYYRLIFGESDFLPGLIVDRFNHILVVQINTLGMDIRTELIVATLREILPDTQGILLRNDSSARQWEGLEQFIKPIDGKIPDEVLIEENNAQFYAPLLEGQKTGWFYDHRLNRSRLSAYVNNQRVLDVFSYLGAWGIQAACYGAKEVICLDSSPLSTVWIPKNAALNHVANKISVLQQDAFIGLKQLQQDKEQFNVIILDPPAFIKKQKDIKEGTIAYQRIIELALKLLHPDGILIACSCSQHINDEEWTQVIRRAGQRSGSDLQILEWGHQAPDHPVHIAIPETRYLKMIITRRL